LLRFWPLKTSSEAQLRQYLLGDLDPAGQAWIEEQYLGDHRAFERLQLIEDELTDAYVRDELPDAERVLFERQYLAGEYGREKVEAARALMQCFAELPNPAGIPSSSGDRLPSRFSHAFRRWVWPVRRMPAPVTAVAAIALIAGLAGTVVLLNEQLRTARVEQTEAARREQELRTQAEQERERLQQLTAELQQERASRLAAQQSLEAMQPGSIAAVVLTPGLLRDAAAPPRVVKRANTTQLVLQLQLPDTGYDGYRAILRQVSGGETWRQEFSPPVPADSEMLTITIPAARVAPGDYLLALQGRVRDGAFDDVSSYFFQVVQ
jgi:hypothetical protein